MRRMWERVAPIIFEPVVAPLVQRLEAIMADVQKVQQDFTTFRQEIKTKVDAIDNVLEGLSDQVDELQTQVANGQVDQAAVDQLATDLAAARAQVQSISPTDPSGDDAPPAPTDG
jgi:cell division FtsZ-interacting protein ZapD